MLDLVDFGKSGHSGSGKVEDSAQAEGKETSDHDDNDEKAPDWLKFKQYVYFLCLYPNQA